MSNERKVLGLLVLVIAAAAGLAFVIRWKSIMLPPEPVPPAPIEQPVPPGETPKPVYASRTFQSADDVTVVTVPAWSEKEQALSMENPTVVMGTSTTFESRIAWKLTDASGRIISEGGTRVNSPDAGVPGPFRISLFYDAAPATDRGTLHVFEGSAKDGSPIHDVKIPVKFLYTSGKGHGCEATVKVAFSNTKEDPNMLDCSKTSVVERNVCGRANPALGLHELLKGPNGAERQQGFMTSLPAGVPDPRVSADRYDFDETLETGVAGSCRVGNIRAQILNTILANSAQTGGDEPVISIDGRTEDILQP